MNNYFFMKYFQKYFSKPIDLENKLFETKDAKANKQKKTVSL